MALIEALARIVTRKKKAVLSTAEVTTLDDLLPQGGKRDEFQTIAVKEVFAWEIEQAA